MSKFSLDDSEHDLNTFTGRLWHFFDIVSPHRLFYSDKTIRESQIALEDFKYRTTLAKIENRGDLLLTNAEVEHLREAKKIVQSSIHPDTGDKIPFYCRMCGFVPGNIPIIFGMLCTQPTTFNTVFFQWLNQTYNAAMNYGNRNASSPYSMKDLAFSYTGAVTTSIAVALGMRALARKALGNKALTGAKLKMVNTLVAYVAAATAGATNLCLIRQTELKTGIKVYDEEGKERGYSKVCAQQAIIQSALSRVVLPIPVVCLPGILLTLIASLKLVPSSRAGSIILELCVLTFGVWIGLPIALSLFPQRAKIEASKLEPDFRGLHLSNGEQIKHYYFNKGL